MADVLDIKDFSDKGNKSLTITVDGSNGSLAPKGERTIPHICVSPFGRVQVNLSHEGPLRDLFGVQGITGDRLSEILMRHYAGVLSGIDDPVSGIVDALSLVAILEPNGISEALHASEMACTHVCMVRVAYNMNGDCNASECERYAKGYAELSASYTAKAEAYRQLKLDQES